MNIEICGKHTETDFECPVCGATLTPTECEQSFGGDMGFMERGSLMATYYPSRCEVVVKFVCYECRSEVELSVPDSARLLTVSEPGPSEPSEWEYVIMALTSVKYGRVKNLGNYETERIEAEAEIGSGSPEEALTEVKRFVKDQLGLGPSADEVEAAREVLREAGEL